MSYSHTIEDIDITLQIIHKVFIVYKKALEEGVEKYLTGRSVQAVFRKMN